MKWDLEELVEAMNLDSQEDEDFDFIDDLLEDERLPGKRNLEKIQVIYSGPPSDRGIIVHSCGMELILPFREESTSFIMTSMDTGELLFIEYVWDEM